MIKNETMDDMVEFTSVVMDHCRCEAQHATEVVMGALNYLTRDDAVDLQSAVQALQESSNSDEHVRSLKQTLSTLQLGVVNKTSHQQLIAAILQQLQFQDYVSQQMNVLVKMLEHWLQTRRELGEAVELSGDQLLAFGNALAAMTVSEDEKAIVQRHIAGVELAVAEPEEVDDFLF
ncbi:MAG: hypothetical protein V3V12_01510 [Gammaproteobacteria bacterium]